MTKKKATTEAEVSTENTEAAETQAPAEETPVTPEAEAELEEGDEVSFTLSHGEVGHGFILGDGRDNHFLVVVEQLNGHANEMKPVIYCARTWLTKE